MILALHHVLSLLAGSCTVLPSASAVQIPPLNARWWLENNPAITQPVPALGKTDLEPMHFKEFGSKRVLIRYGPYKVPPSTESHGMKEFNTESTQKPCEDCYIIGLQAGLEYMNGSRANTNTGMWLHHAVLYDFGRQDIACGTMPYRFFASGNERTRLDMSLNG
jgi:hypothetical protein